MAEQPAQPTIKATYTGARDAQGVPTQYHSGVPARDLTEDEYHALTEGQRATVTASPYYTVAGATGATEPPPSPAPAPPEPPEPPAPAPA